MDEKLSKILLHPTFEPWRANLWKEISTEAIQHGWVSREDIRPGDRCIDPESDRWSQLYARLVEIRYLFRYPVARSVHARFLHPVPKSLKKVDVGYLSFHTSPNPTPDDKALFEARRSMRHIHRLPYYGENTNIVIAQKNYSNGEKQAARRHEVYLGNHRSEPPKPHANRANNKRLLKGLSEIWSLWGVEEDLPAFAEVWSFGA